MRVELKNHLLIIFVDAFPFTHRDRIVSKIPCMFSSAKMTPSFGYSINLKTELLAGLNADEAGFFNEFTYDFSHEKVPLIYKILGWFCRRNFLIDSLAHKIFYRIFRKNIFKIPFQYLPLFKKNGTEAYARDYSKPTVLSRFRFERILYSDFPGRSRDRNVSLKLNETICNSKKPKCSRIFAAYCEVDHKTHELGVGNLEHDAMIEEFVDSIKGPIENFVTKYPDGKVVVFSDHGMCSPSKSISVDLESMFGAASPDKYVYFVDATVVRIWIFQKELEEKIHNYFKNLHPGVIILSDGDRKKYNISNRDFGHMIVTLDESLQFAPNFFSRTGASGMHGYLPSYESQQGIVVANFNLPVNDFLPKKFYEFACSLADF